MKTKSKTAAYLGSLVAAMAVVVFGFLHPAVADKESSVRTCKTENLYCISDTLSVGSEAMATLSSVDVQPPAVQQAELSKQAAGTVTYSVATRGQVTASVAQFKTQVQETYDHKKGWSQLGITFQRVEDGGDFVLVLATAEQVPSFSSACSALYSCRVGKYTIINEDRWQGATPSWNEAGGSLRNYRHMVVNHETGHWLGHGHANCPGPGQSAPLMQQQSIDLQGCAFNPWPLAKEIHSPRLGI